MEDVALIRVPGRGYSTRKQPSHQALSRSLVCYEKETNKRPVADRNEQESRTTERMDPLRYDGIV